MIAAASNPGPSVVAADDARGGDASARGAAQVCVFGPALFATVTIESDLGQDDQDAVHFHPGGQAFWIARMVNHLGDRCALVSPVGGEAGVVLAALAPTWDVELIAVPTTAESPAYVHDRRDGGRRQVAMTPGGTLTRHEIDDLYGRLLEVSTATKTCVITGSRSGRALGQDFYRRLGSDLAELDVVTVGDLHGPELDAFLDGGPLSVLKLSDEDLVDDGRLDAGHVLEDRVRTGRDLCDLGAEIVVVSDSTGALLVEGDGDVWYAEPPLLDPVDHRGAGDAMSAALCVATRRHDSTVDMLRFGCAAGAATVARRGLGNAEVNVIEALVEHVEITRVTDR